MPGSLSVDVICGSSRPAHTCQHTTLFTGRIHAARQPLCKHHSLHQAPCRSHCMQLPHWRVSTPHRQHAKAQATATEASPASTPSAPAGSNGAQQRRQSQPAPRVPDSLRKQTAVLYADNPSAPNGKATVYVLGVSHVSQQSCDSIKELISAIQPDAVMIELCRDRVGLLLPKKSVAKSGSLWFAPEIVLQDVPTDDGWPSLDEIRKLLKCQPNASVTTHDIENDCRRLLATGLFASVRPLLKPPIIAVAPQFIERSDSTLVPSVPAGTINFVLVPRSLPKVNSFSARIDSSLGGGLLEGSEVDAISEDIVKATADGTSTVTALLQAKSKVEELARRQLGRSSQASNLEVSFSGAYTGEVEAIVKAAAPADQRLPYVSGFESSAVGGVGPGIQGFRPYRGSVELTPRMTIDNLANIMPLETESIDDVLGPLPHASNGSAHAQHHAGIEWRPWTSEERKAAADAEDEEEENEEKPSLIDTGVETFGQWLTSTYAGLQGKAGEAVGIAPGEAWRTAVQAAADAGASQVHLGDLPASVSGKRLAVGVLQGVALRIGAAAALTAGLVAANVAHRLPEGPVWAAPAAAAAAWVAAAWSVGGPFLEVWLFSRKSAEEVEDAVAVREALQGGGQGMYRLKGEDALIGFPGAPNSVIRDRDIYMARTLRAAATGEPGSPALTKDSKAEGRRIWRYMMPEGAQNAEHALQDAAPFVGGEGLYQPNKQAFKVVGVVGSAHVRGIIEHWDAAASDEAAIKVLSKD